MSILRQLNLSSLRLLIVDSDDFYRSILHSVLKGFGARGVVEAADAHEALRAFGAEEIDILFTEWVRLGAPAADYIQQIRRAANGANFMLPIFVITSEPTRRNVLAARDAGANEVLAKPISAKVLFDRLHEVITNPRTFVRARDYVGPDRRRFRSSGYEGPERRGADEA